MPLLDSGTTSIHSTMLWLSHTISNAIKSSSILFLHRFILIWVLKNDRKFWLEIFEMFVICIVHYFSVFMVTLSPVTCISYYFCACSFFRFHSLFILQSKRFMPKQEKNESIEMDSNQCYILIFFSYIKRRQSSVKLEWPLKICMYVLKRGRGVDFQDI